MERDQSDEEKINKIKKIVTREIEKEIVNKQDEVMEITSKIEKVLRNLDILKYVVTVNYFENNPGLTSKKVGDQEEDSKDEKAQTQIHPCVKKLLPFRSNYAKSFGDGSHSYETRKSKQSTAVNAGQATVTKESSLESLSKADEGSANGVCDSAGVKSENSGSDIQLPQYIPPLPNPDLVKQVVNSPRGGSSRVQHRIIVGNVSKWIPPDTREDNSTHKWMVYIRNQEREKDVTQLIRKVRYFLHESYKPHDIIDVTSAPFHLTRRGWGEFPIRVQLHFHHPLNKPVDIIHHLKLDMTCSGVQTLGAETVVELWLHQGNSDAAQSKNKRIVPESEYANGKRTERGDVFDGNLLMPLNGRALVAMNEAEKSAELSEVSESLESERTDTSERSNSRNLMLDRRKLQEIIELEHDYVKTDHSGDGKASEIAANPFFKLITGKNGDVGSTVALKNGTVFDSGRTASRKNRNLSRMEISMYQDERDVFRSLRSAVNKFESETQSKYCLKVFRHSYLVNILQRAHATKLKSVEALVKWFFRRWPIVTKLAADPTYKHIHPYSCPSEEEFFQYNIGKQRSSEWFRAKAIQKNLISLKPVIPIEEEIWTTKQILLWGRFHGYSPASFAKPTGEESRSASQGGESSSKRLKSNESNSDSDCDSSDWIVKKGKSNDGKFVNGLSLVERKRNFKRGRKKFHAEEEQFHAKNYRGVSTYSDGNDVARCGALEYRVLHCKSPPEIDVVNVDDDLSPGSAPSTDDAEKKKEKLLTVTTIPSDEIHMSKFVSGATRQIGIRLTNEEVIPGVMCDSVVRVMSQAAVNFLDELLRRSLAQAWLRNGDRAPDSLEYEDVLATLLEHPQFDIFTNRGLGIQPVVKSEP